MFRGGSVFYSEYNDALAGQNAHRDGSIEARTRARACSLYKHIIV